MTRPTLTRLRLRARWARRRLRHWLARQLRRLERLLDPLPRDPGRAAAIARHPAGGVVPTGYAQGRADLQLTHRAACRCWSCRRGIDPDLH